MILSSWRTRLTVPAGPAAVLLVTGGTLSCASAADWTYANDCEGNCLTAPATTDKVWSDSCNDSLATRNWHWGSVTTDAFGHTFRRLVSNANGDCLTTDSKSLDNAVWMSPAVAAAGSSGTPTTTAS